MMSKTRYQIKAAFFGFFVGGLLGTCPITISILVYATPPVIEVAYGVGFMLGGITGLLFAVMISPLVTHIKIPTILLFLSAGTLLGAIPCSLITEIPFFSLPGGILGYWIAFFALIYFTRRLENGPQ